MCLLNAWHARRCIAPIACSWRRIPKFWNWMRALKIEKETRMYGTCETLCRELAAKYPGYTPLMLVIWSPEDQRIESGISSAAAMEIISNVSENRQVTVPAELLASLIQTAEQALWKREWAARDYGLAVPECVTRRQAVVNQARILLKNNTHESG
ncbi:DUF1380 family protein [Escherichia coli]|uniref:DUF1380 family protein n=1 Tax=Escherichia coli TaxID=562 RepID=UPI000CDB04E0|nr:DUF1380 family protein [Escherichia coli]EFA8124033.1 DUF1380 domain-containing protein [Escherichia coli]EFE5943196.1 DUF1380 domain-containing protein [Escherichia coli]EII2921258.1 DUF1380 family protein [Escherichia coli]EJT6703020.1 DUF1380 family protein [Escherichia coli]EKJ3252208.1 DUF1380 family protein [Escherichia coli]